MEPDAKYVSDKSMGRERERDREEDFPGFLCLGHN